MSAPAGNSTTNKSVAADTTKDSKTQPLQTQKPAAQLEEDDEFEDFPVEDWAKEEEVGSKTANTHLWEESWDDDDTTDDFSIQLKEQIKKMESQRKN